jgi:hypothetical protein
MAETSRRMKWRTVAMVVLATTLPGVTMLATPAGAAQFDITTVRTPDQLGSWNPLAQADNGDVFWILSSGLHRMTPQGVVTNLGGQYVGGQPVDGPLATATWNDPRRPTVDGQGNLYFVDLIDGNY